MTTSTDRPRHDHSLPVIDRSSSGSTATARSDAGHGRSGIGRLIGAGVLAAVVAAVANLAVFFVAREVFGISFDMPYRGSELEPLPPGMVVAASAVPALVAAALFGLLGLFLQRPLRVFQVIALLALLASFGGPLSLSDVGTSTRVGLIAMHVVAAAAIVGVLTALARGHARAAAR